VGAALSAEETTLLLRERLPAAGIGVNDALLAALSLAFSTWTGDSCMLVNVSLHGRDPFMPGVDVSRTVGWFISVFPVVLDTAGALDMTELASRITRQLDAVPNRGIGFGALRYLHPDPGVREIMQQVPRPVVSFNYQGEMDRLPSRSILVDETSNWTQRIGEDQVWGAQVRVLAHVAQGQLQVSIGFNDGLYDARALECVASAFVAALRSLLDQDVNELEGAG
jgi:non-ribosomal peptide synthase protein (TIGR01720 family)